MPTACHGTLAHSEPHANDCVPERIGGAFALAGTDTNTEPFAIVHVVLLSLSASSGRLRTARS